MLNVSFVTYSSRGLIIIFCLVMKPFDKCVTNGLTCYHIDR